MNSNPYLLLTPPEALRIQHHVQSNNDEDDLLTRTVQQTERQTRKYINTIGIEIPGHGEAGGYEHNRHKQNYIHLNHAGSLWLITQETYFFDWIKNMLLKYAEVYPTLTLNTSRDTNPPGRLFHQTLNENMWLMYASIAYACIKENLSDDERNKIENDLFREMVAMFTDTYAHDFDIIHNHGLWAVAGVGVAGMALNDDEIANKAIYGLKGDGETGGFLAQLKYLFSPDGYYMEGPYYHRFALRPLLIFAEVISRKRPELNIFQFEDCVIQRTSEALMSTVFPDGTFPALNDSSKTIGINDEGMIIAASLCYKHFGADEKLVAMAQVQQEVWLADSSIALSIAASGRKKPLNWGSLTITDGPMGEKGGLGILRRAVDDDIHMAMLWYGQHGSDHTLHSALDHGHFDGLHLGWFNRGQEVLKDYGFGRWVNVEPKFGGRYIPENKSYCKQTIAHNTVTVDQQSQNGGDTATAEKHWGDLAFFETKTDFGQVLSAKAPNFFPGVDMQRTIVMLDRKNGSPLLIDLFDLQSDDEHVYDLPVHYDGQITHTDFSYKTYNELKAAGKEHGYQHLWHIATSDPLTHQNSAMLSWLMGDSYYSLRTATTEQTNILFLQTGANDPAFNLRNEPVVITRERAANHLFATTYEQHGYFNESLEKSEDARGSIDDVQVLYREADANIIRIIDQQNGTYILMHWKLSNVEETHQVETEKGTFTWSGSFAVEITT